MEEILIKNYSSFSIFGEEVSLYSQEFEYGTSTVAEVKDTFHYLGNVPATISTAIVIWQDLNKKTLDDEELKQILKDNHLISEAI